MKMYSRIYFSLSLFLVISERLQTRQKIKSTRKIPDKQYMLIDLKKRNKLKGFDYNN